MKRRARITSRKHSRWFFTTITLALAYSLYIDQVVGLPSDTSTNSWPTFPRRNVAALARDGYLKSIASGFKRSISTLAKNGQLPTYRSPYDETDKQEQDDEEVQEKRNLASIARLRSYSAMKRNVQSLARDGYRFGRGQYSNDKRNIAALARNGLIHKKDEITGDEYFYPFYQNPVPPLSEMDGPLDFNEMYDFQQSVNPEMFPPLSQVFKRDVGYSPDSIDTKIDYDGNWYLKRGAIGMPVHGLYRPIYIESNGNTKSKRSIYSIPDVLDRNDIPTPDDYDNDNDDKRSVEDDDIKRENFEKRHIGSLARLGLLPSFRFSGGRYSRSGRARLLLPSQELYRKHSHDENFGSRQYLPDPEIDIPIDSDDTDLPPPPIPAYSHPTGRKHSHDENFGSRQYLPDPEIDIPIDSDDTDLPPPPIPAYSHPTGRYLHRPLNDLPNTPLPQSPLSLNYHNSPTKDRWQFKKNPKFYYFRSLKVPYHASDKRYLLLPAVDNILLKKTYRNSSLPSRRKNQ